MKIITASIIFVLFHFIGSAQSTDSIFVKIVRKESGKEYNLYNLTIFNHGSKPAAILHSPYILWGDPAPKFALVKREPGIEYYSLNYAAKDTVYDHPLNNLYAEIIIPLQRTSFDVAIPNSSNLQKLGMDYILLADLHYNNFKQKIDDDASKWYKEYEKNTNWINLPENSFPIYLK